MSVKISPLINLYNINNISFSQKAKKKQHCCNKNKVQDVFVKEEPKIADLFFKSKNIVSGLTFNKPVLINDALFLLASTKEPTIIKSLAGAFHPQEEFVELANLVVQNKDLKNVKITSLVGFGAYSLAFETSKGEILKISDGNQFYDNRKIAWFDLPIRKQGSLGKKYFYYFEEKIKNDCLTDTELLKFIEKIKDSGYSVSDYIRLSSVGDDVAGDLKKEQFGKAKNGQIYLVDPGCAREIPKSLLSSFLNLEKVKEFCIKFLLG